MSSTDRMYKAFVMAADAEEAERQAEANPTTEVVLRLTPAEATTLYDLIGNHASVYHGTLTRSRLCLLRRRLRSALADLGMFSR